MSKEKDIANIVKQLNSLSINNARYILNYIESTKNKKKGQKQQTELPAAEYVNSEGTILQEGDKVTLLTPGIDNHKYEEGKVHKLPKVKGKWIHLIPKQFYQRKHPFTIRKYSTNVRKVQE